MTSKKVVNYNNIMQRFNRELGNLMKNSLQNSSKFVCLKRVKNEIKELYKECPSQIITIIPNEDDLCEWGVIIGGMEDLPYEGGQFLLKIRFPLDFPFAPPQIKFITKIYHPNIISGGKIFISILQQGGWTPALSVEKIILSISSLICNPNTHICAHRAMADLYDNDRDQFNKNARDWTLKYALTDVDWSDNFQVKKILNNYAIDLYNNKTEEESFDDDICNVEIQKMIMADICRNNKNKLDDSDDDG
jgi:ubiquitin-conjugating enzyme E2 D